MADANRIGRGHAYIWAVHAEALEAAGLEPEISILDEGDVVYVSWRAAPTAGPALAGTNTFVVSAGLITVNTAFITAGADSGGRLVDELA